MAGKLVTVTRHRTKSAVAYSLIYVNRFACVPCSLEQEKMKHEMAALQRLLESKEKRMAELQSGSGQVPALKQHYDRVLADLQKERDSLMQEKVTIMQVCVWGPSHMVTGWGKRESM